MAKQCMNQVTGYRPHHCLLSILVSRAFLQITGQFFFFDCTCLELLSVTACSSDVFSQESFLSTG